jgi:glycosyltransferase involved in cell wall biosynthesis
MEYFYKSIDVLIQPSVDDGFNMSTIESLSCGVPTYVNTNMGSLEFLKKLTPKNTFNIKEKYSLLMVLNRMNLKNFKKDSHLIKNKFNNIYKKFNSQNYLSFDNLFKS